MIDLAEALDYGNRLSDVADALLMEMENQILEPEIIEQARNLRRAVNAWDAMVKEDA